MRYNRHVRGARGRADHKLNNIIKTIHYRLLQNNFDGFNKRKPKSILRRLQSCDGGLLDKLYRLQFIRRPVRHCCLVKTLRYKREERNAMINRYATSTKSISLLRNKNPKSWWLSCIVSYNVAYRPYSWCIIQLHGTLYNTDLVDA